MVPRDDMTLLEQLTEALPAVLSSNPSERKTATELIELLRQKLPIQFNEQTVRQYLSNIASTPGSGVAKYDGGNGYYRIPEPSNFRLEQSAYGCHDAPEVASADPSDSEAKANEGRRDDQPEEKFRSVYRRYLEVVERRLTLSIEHTAATKREKGMDKWKYPDVVSVHWQVDVDVDRKLDKHALHMKRSLGEQPFIITSTELKAVVTVADARMAFFQCLSNSRWAHYAVLAIAVAVDENALATELRRLGAAYGIEIQSYGLTLDTLQGLQSASAIVAMDDATFEHEIASKISVKTLVPGSLQARLDWGYLQDMRSISEDFRGLVRWISFCLEHGKALPFAEAKPAMDVLD